MLYEKGGETKQFQEETSYQLGAGIEAFQRNKRTFYYHQDEQLNTALITNRNGEIKNQYQYDAFGNGLEAVEELPNRIRYTGQQYDQQTEQYYLRARYYNPIVGRFTQEDVYQGDGLNLYTYCRNSPVVYYDPSGYADKFLPNGSRINWGEEHGKNNPPHNNSIEVELDWASSVGAYNIMKNKRQEDAAGNRVYFTDPDSGKSRFIKPDASYTIDNIRFNTNYVSNNKLKSEMVREMRAFEHMVEADPNAVNSIIIEYTDPLQPKTDEIKETNCK